MKFATKIINRVFYIYYYYDIIRIVQAWKRNLIKFWKNENQAIKKLDKQDGWNEFAHFSFFLRLQLIFLLDISK